MDNNQYGYSYYHNFYNMFGGYNPVIDSEVKRLRRLGVAVGGGMLLFTVMQYVVAFLINLFGVNDLYNSDAVFQNGVSALSPFIYVFLPFVITLLFYKKEDRNITDFFNAPKSKELFLFSVFSGLLICSLGNTATSFLSNIVSLIGADFDKPDTAMPNSWFGNFLLIVAYAVVPPLVEEFAMRGVVMQPLRKYGDKFAITVSAILFAVLHGNMIQIPFAFVAGLALGYFAIVTESIWTSVAIHCINNLSSAIISIYYTKYTEANMLFYFAIEGAIFALGILAFILFRLMKPKKLNNQTDEIGNNLKYSTFFCTPTVVICIFISLITSISYTKINSFGGFMFVTASLILIAVLLAKGSATARNDVRITKSGMYTASTVITIVSSFFIFIISVMLPAITGQR